MVPITGISQRSAIQPLRSVSCKRRTAKLILGKKRNNAYKPVTTLYAVLSLPKIIPTTILMMILVIIENKAKY